MATRYVEMLAIQRPFPIGLDEANRVMFSCNFDALAAAPVGSFEEEILSVLNGAGLATRYNGATETGDTTIGPGARIPDGAGPWVELIDYGGRAPAETQNGSKYERLSIQVVVRATNYDSARTRALAIWRALDGLRDATVSP